MPPGTARARSIGAVVALVRQRRKPFWPGDLDLAIVWLASHSPDGARAFVRKVGSVRSISVGQEGSLEQVVSPEHGADHFQNPGVTVLATPVLCHWFESAAVRAIAEHIEPAEATVGTRVSIEHLKATPVGMHVRVTARVVAVDGRRVNFEISAFDDVELVARGAHERFVVDLERFLAGVQSKTRVGSERGADGR